MKTFITTCLLIIGLLTPSLIFGQSTDDKILSISGKVYDATSRENLPYAHVYNLSKKEGTITDASGFFKIPVSDGDSLKISFVGYNDKIVRFRSKFSYLNDFVEFALVRKVYELSEVVVNPLGTYEQFLWKVANLDLPQSKEERLTVSLNLLAQKEIDKVKNKAPKYLHPAMGISSGGFGVNLDRLAMAKIRIEEAKGKKRKNEMLYDKFSKDLVKHLSGFEGQKLDSFFVYCNANTNFNYLVSDYEISLKIVQLLNEFRSQNDTL